MTPEEQPCVSAPDSQPGQSEVTLVYVVQWRYDERTHWRDEVDAEFADLAAARRYEPHGDVYPLRIIERYTRETIVEILPDSRWPGEPPHGPA